MMGSEREETAKRVGEGRGRGYMVWNAGLKWVKADESIRRGGATNHGGMGASKRSGEGRGMKKGRVAFNFL